MSNEPDPPFPEGRARRQFYEPGGRGDAVFTFRRLSDTTYRVTTQFDYVDGSGVSYRVPFDTETNETDLASIPPIVTWLVPRDGRHTPAAVLHDALIGGRNGADYVVAADGDVSDRDADHLFQEAMSGLGVAWLRRWMMWAAVALRTLTMTVDPDTRAPKKNWVRLIPVGLLVVVWVVAFAWMALDVPDISRWSLPLFGDRPVLLELAAGLGMVAAGSVALAMLFGLVLQSVRGVTAGAIAGVAIGFLALPLLASAIGFLMYLGMERVFSALFERARVDDVEGTQYEVTVEPDPAGVASS